MAKLKHYGADAPRSLSDILLFEIDPRFSREHGEFAPVEENVPMGAVLCLNDKGQYVPFGQELSPAVESVEASEGVAAVEGKPAIIADDPCAILVSREIEACEEAQDCVVIRRGACVAVANLFWHPGVTEEQKKTALAALASLSIVPKE